jgi:23S rRNA pseudouridine2605 synthase
VAEIRLQVHLARAGVMSRRHAEDAIASGRVAVNGAVVTELGTKVDPAKDRVELDGQRVGAPEPPATLMLFKPDNVMTTLDDPRGRATVAEIVSDEPYRFVPVGRLDYHTEGLLLMSTDGDLIHRLLHPRHHVPKAYRVCVKGHVTPTALDRLRDGVDLDDGPTRPAIAEVLTTDERTTWLEILVTEGRNRLVRRMCEAVGHEVRRIVRTEFGTLFVGDLKPGQYRYLAPDELHALYRAADLAPKSPPPRFDAVGTAVLGTSQRHKGPIPGVHEPKPGTQPAGRRRIAAQGRARPLDAPIEDDELPELRRRFTPKIAESRPDGVPENRKPGYPDTRVWRSDRTRGRSHAEPELDDRIVRVRAEREDRRRGRDARGPEDARAGAPRRGPRGRDDRGARRGDDRREPGPRGRASGRTGGRPTGRTTGRSGGRPTSPRRGDAPRGRDRPRDDRRRDDRRGGRPDARRDDRRGAPRSGRPRRGDGSGASPRPRSPRRGGPRRR